MFSFICINLRNRHIVPLLHLAKETNDHSLIDVINQLVANNPIELNHSARNESIAYCIILLCSFAHS